MGYRDLRICPRNSGGVWREDGGGTRSRGSEPDPAGCTGATIADITIPAAITTARIITLARPIVPTTIPATTIAPTAIRTDTIIHIIGAPAFISISATDPRRWRGRPVSREPRSAGGLHRIRFGLVSCGR